MVVLKDGVIKHNTQIKEYPRKKDKKKGGFQKF
jgi:hypothetical protein